MADQTTSDQGPHPVVDGTITGRLALHLNQPSQLDPGGVTLTFTRFVSLRELEEHPMIATLLRELWTIEPLSEAFDGCSYWILRPPQVESW